MKKIKAIKFKQGTLKQRKNHALILGLVAVAGVVAFLMRTFPDQVAQATGWDSGMISIWADTVLGMSVAIVLMYMGFALIGSPLLGLFIGLLGVITAYFTLKKVL